MIKEKIRQIFSTAGGKTVKPLDIVVYGSDAPCPSCLHSPSSIETKEWIEAAINRKYPDEQLKQLRVRYVDIEHPGTQEEKLFCDKIFAEEYFYPLIVINGEVAGEGDPRLKGIYEVIDKQFSQP
jgi:disulfide oxidoreductase YuzD